MTDKSNRLVIISKGIGIKYEAQFFKDFQEAILNGYRVADNNLREDQSMRNFRGKFGRAVLYLEDVEDTEIQDEEISETKEDPVDEKAEVPQEGVTESEKSEDKVVVNTEDKEVDEDNSDSEVETEKDDTEKPAPEVKPKGRRGRPKSK